MSKLGTTAARRWINAMALLAPAALAALGPALADAQGRPRGPTEVIVQKVVRGPFSDRLEALGTLLPVDGVSLTVGVTERVRKLNFQDGDWVEQGAVLVELERSEEQALLIEAEASLTEARSTLREAEAQLERAKALTQRGASTGQQLDERQRDVDTAKARIETAKARIAAARSKLEDRIIRAPFSGRIGLTKVSIGAVVESGDAIADLFNDRVMKLDFSVPSAFLPTLKPGLRIRAQAKAFGETPFEGEVRSIDNQVDPVTRSIVVRALLPNQDGRLRAGLLMGVELYKDERMAVIAPEEALIPTGGGQSVLLIAEKDGQSIAERRPVKIGGRRPGDVEIVEGLQPGDLVITHGTLKIRPGAPVKIKAIETGDEALPRLLTQTPDAKASAKPNAQPAAKN